MDNEKVAICLQETGLGKEMVERYVHSKSLAEKLCILTKFRAVLLDKLRKDQRSLECLDYIIYELRKSEER